MRTLDLRNFKSSVLSKSVDDGNRLHSLNFESLHLGGISKPYFDYRLIEGIDNFDEFKALGVSRSGGVIRPHESKLEVMSKLQSVLKSAYMDAYDKVGIVGKTNKRKRVKANYPTDGETSDAEKLMRKCADILTGQHVPSGGQQFEAGNASASLNGILDKIKKVDFKTMFVHTVPTQKVVVDADTKEGKFPDFGIFQTLVFPDFGIFQTLAFSRLWFFQIKSNTSLLK
ncbi:hypothetical protein TrRE_jg7783 [Triparma retinervis]|uniref:Uncharacterized protein n=1 Tax=Triparma retinervis TaxID=2557542 RepID=A0A9W6ZIX7_9STRA|nr:hypothetical protein TrRE_jg7783 [Triparma retinervis]